MSGLLGGGEEPRGLGWLLSQSGLGAATQVPLDPEGDADPAAGNLPKAEAVVEPEAVPVEEDVRPVSSVPKKQDWFAPLDETESAEDGSPAAAAASELGADDTTRLTPGALSSASGTTDGSTLSADDTTRIAPGVLPSAAGAGGPALDADDTARLVPGGSSAASRGSALDALAAGAPPFGPADGTSPSGTEAADPSALGSPAAGTSPTGTAEDGASLSGTGAAGPSAFGFPVAGTSPADTAEGRTSPSGTEAADASSFGSPVAGMSPTGTGVGGTSPSGVGAPAFGAPVAGASPYTSTGASASGSDDGTAGGGTAGGETSEDGPETTIFGPGTTVSAFGEEIGEFDDEYGVEPERAATTSGLFTRAVPASDPVTGVGSEVEPVRGESATEIVEAEIVDPEPDGEPGSGAEPETVVSPADETEIIDAEIIEEALALARAAEQLALPAEATDGTASTAAEADSAAEAGRADDTGPESADGTATGDVRTSGTETSASTGRGGTDANGTDANGTDANGTDANGTGASEDRPSGAAASGTGGSLTDTSATGDNRTDASGTSGSGSATSAADATGAGASGDGAGGTEGVADGTSGTGAGSATASDAVAGTDDAAEDEPEPASEPARTPVVLPEIHAPIRQKRAPLSETDRRRQDPEQVLAAYPLVFDPQTLRERVEEKGRLLGVIDRLTDKLEFAERDTVRARLLSLRAVAARLLDDLNPALEDAREALTHAESSGDLRLVALVKARLAHVLLWRGDHADADRVFAESSTAEVPPRLRAEIEELAGRSAFDQGRLLEAMTHLETALDLSKAADPELVERVELALDVITRRGVNGWGPQPRTREEILGKPGEPRPVRDAQTGLFGFPGLVQPVFAQAQPFADGVAWVRRPEAPTWELIDTAGRLLIDASSGYRAAARFSEGLAWVARDQRGGWFAIDKQNRVIVSGGFEDAKPFHNGIALIKRDGWGAVDKHGRPVVQPRYQGFATTLVGAPAVDGFTEEGLAVVDAGGELGVVDRTGHLVVAPVHAAVRIHPEAFLVSDKYGLWGALDRKGEPLIELKYRKPGDVLDELAKQSTEQRPVV